MIFQEMPNQEEQRWRLQKLLEAASEPEASKTATFGAMLFFARAGDVCFLAPINPAMRGVEIVSASPPRADGRDYDIWEHGRLIRSNQTTAEIVAWLKARGTQPEAVYLKHVVAWTEATLAYYGLRQRR